MRRLRGPAAVLASALLLTGCAQSVDPIERLGKKAAEGVHPHVAPGREHRHRGLARPLARPPAHPARPFPRPPARPLAGHPAVTAPPPVVDRVPTRDPVVFLTYGDGAERDPRFVDMVRALRLPVTLFLTGSAAAPGHRHFARLRALGAGIGNHTLGRRAPAGLPYAGQRAEICGQQDRLRARLGVRPRLFRPPHGSYDPATLRAAADCGISAVVLWRTALTPAGLTRGLAPGDIVLVDPDASGGVPLRERTARVLRAAQERGLTVARLEDYL
ncbi:polysaccharide deacetylase family protein [Streptomyces sp. SudanB182_2057]|uniref:polysaccharide deacetylase family protein n=1 Tax=Streptomyces sp. SudanB182_2057 TaxID=3035281 RepID=UPI003F568947